MKRDMSGYRTRILEEVREALEALDLEQVETALEEIINAEHVFCDGLGRSGLSMRGFAMRLGQMGKKGVLVGEATAPAFGSGDLLVICTASGDVAGAPASCKAGQALRRQDPSDYRERTFRAFGAFGRSDSDTGSG